MNTIQDYIGTKFWRLTILSLVGKSSKGGVRCKCECGKIKIVNFWNLKRGLIKSCGCFRKECSRSRQPAMVAKYVTKYHGKVAQYRTFSIYRGWARRRNLAFELTFEDFQRICSQNCVYCGCLPSNTARSFNTKWVYNGIDRVKNDIGYVLDNVVPCCHQCNWAKKDLTPDQFRQWVVKVFMNLYQHIDTAEQLPRTQQQDSMAQDNANKTAFALKMMNRIPQEATPPAEAPRIPSLGAMAVPN